MTLSQIGRSLTSDDELKKNHSLDVEKSQKPAKQALPVSEQRRKQKGSVGKRLIQKGFERSYNEEVLKKEMKKGALEVECCSPAGCGGGVGR